MLAQNQSSPQEPLSRTEDASVEIPEFSGPWAAEFTSAFRSSGSELERQVLQDEKITEMEFAEIENRFKSCMTAQKVSFTRFNPGGGFDFSFADGMTSEQANQVADDCAASTGINTVGSLYFQMQRNPQNLDQDTIGAGCLVEKGVAPKGYTASDYKRDAQLRPFPLATNEQATAVVDACERDPLGLLG
jgi:hypothetical protein